MNIKQSVEQLEGLIEAWGLNEADLNQTDIDALMMILKENQELKQKYLNAVSDYETTMAEKEQLNSLVNSCQEEIRQLKKQIKDKIPYIIQNNLCKYISIEKYKNKVCANYEIIGDNKE